MRICIKVSVWEEIKIDPEGMTDLEITSLIRKNQDNIIDYVYNKTQLATDSEFLLETESQISLEENGGFATVELYDDENNLIYANGN